jgi:mycofactocin system creatininase family protein
MTARRLADLTWAEAAEGADRTVLAVPLGATEQHGPHLPIGTDTTIAGALAERLAERRADVLVAPVLAYGASGEHDAFPGTLSIGTEATTTVLVELVRSADAFRGVVLVCGHGGNLDAVRAAVELLTAEGRDVLAWWPSVAGGDAHAGRTETSLLLALEPGGVRVDRAEAGNDRPLAELLPRLRQGGVAAVSPNGILGDPTGASAAEGEQVLDALVEQVVSAVGGRWPQGPDPGSRRGAGRTTPP